MFNLYRLGLVWLELNVNVRKKKYFNIDFLIRCNYLIRNLVLGRFCNVVIRRVMGYS